PSKASPPPWIKGLPELKGDDKLARDKAVKAHELLAAAKVTELNTIDVALAELAGTVQKDLARGKGLSLDAYVNWRHVIRCREAVDDISLILDDLQQENTPMFIRGQCVQSLQQWIAWDRDNDYQLKEALRIYHTKPIVRVKIM